MVLFISEFLMKPIPQYPGYFLSKEYTIIGKKGNELTFSGNPYKYVNVYNNNKASILYLHRAIALVHVPGYFEGAWVDHIDDDPTNNDPSNLHWVTPKNNCYLRKQTSKGYYKNNIEWMKDKISKLRKELEKSEARLEKLEAKHKEK